MASGHWAAQIDQTLSRLQRTCPTSAIACFVLDAGNAWDQARCSFGTRSHGGTWNSTIARPKAGEEGSTAVFPRSFSLSSSTTIMSDRATFNAFYKWKMTRPFCRTPCAFLKKVLNSTFISFKVWGTYTEVTFLGRGGMVRALQRSVLSKRTQILGLILVV